MKSNELILIENLQNASNWHKQNCHDSGCNVSLFLLNTTARKILAYMRAMEFPLHELDEANKIVNNWLL